MTTLDQEAAAAARAAAKEDRIGRNRRRLYRIAETRDKWTARAWQLKGQLEDDPDNEQLQAEHSRAEKLARDARKRLEERSRELKWPT